MILTIYINISNFIIAEINNVLNYFFKNINEISIKNELFLRFNIGNTIFDQLISKVRFLLY